MKEWKRNSVRVTMESLPQQILGITSYMLMMRLGPAVFRDAKPVIHPNLHLMIMFIVILTGVVVYKCAVLQNVFFGQFFKSVLLALSRDTLSVLQRKGCVSEDYCRGVRSGKMVGKLPLKGGLGWETSNEDSYFRKKNY